MLKGFEMKRDICMQFVSLVIFAPSKAAHAVNTLKEDWMQWLTKAAAEIVISSLRVVVLVSFMTS